MKPKRFKPPPFVPKSAATRAKYRKQGRCGDCGSGAWNRGKQCVMTPHHPNCPTLKRIVAVELSGYCAQCGAEKGRELFWDEAMYCVVRKEWCPNGHSHGMAWIQPEDATQAERDELGLIVRGEGEAEA